MPEGDTVWRACQLLHAALAGQALTRTEFRVPALATTDLTGVVVREVVSRGKHQLFRFDNDFTLHSHFRMEGAWRIYPRPAGPAGTARPIKTTRPTRRNRTRPGPTAGTRWTGGPAFQIRAVLGTTGHDVVGYRLPVLELVPTDAEDQVVGHLGPDLLSPDWDQDSTLAEEATRRIRSEPARSIGEALLDQRNLAGIGTFYRAEVLFLQGIHPRRPVDTIPNVPRVVARAHALLFANRWRTDQTTTGDQRCGRRTYVFDRAGQPCRRCRTPIEEEEFGPATQERRSFWCPRCQPAPDEIAGTE